MAELHTIDTKKGFGSHILVETASSSLPLSPPPSSSSSVSPCSSLPETTLPLSAAGASTVDGQHPHHHFHHPGLLDDIRPLDRAPRQSDQQRPHSIVGPAASSERMTTSQLLLRRKSASISEQPDPGLLSRLRPRHTLRPVSSEHVRKQYAPVHPIPHHPSFSAELEPLSSQPSSPTNDGEARHGGAGYPFLDEPNTVSHTDISATRKRPLNRRGPPRTNPRGSQPIPILRRYSTNSMINSIRLSANSDDEDGMEDVDEHHMHQDHNAGLGLGLDLDLDLDHTHDRRESFGAPGSRKIKRQSSKATVLRQDGDLELQAYQCITPDTDTGAAKTTDRKLRRTASKTGSSVNLGQRASKPRRRPLGDISLSTLSDDGCTINASLDDSSLSGRHRRCFYSKQHPTIQGSTRCVLVDWVIHLGYFILRMQPETVHHGVNLLDRYMIEHEEEVHRDRLQCISVAALLVAGKLVETATRLSTNALSFACSRAFSAQNITDQELDLLTTLKFELTVASASAFAQYFKQALDLDEDLDYLIDAIKLALEAKGRVWTKEMEMLSGYSSQTLTPCVLVFMQTLENIQETVPCPFKGLQEKYPKAELSFL
ncbi:hypothetical protein BGZ73_002679 [Actinomortierella ambigua]|nr:hypothetical protein BGZ73_002679 [Actinomortierella ambigua]